MTSLAVTPPTTAETLLERGNYLVNSVMACDICNTPRGPNGLLMDKRFSGGSQTWDEPTYRVKGANITPDRDTGIGTWSADDIKRAMTEACKLNDVDPQAWLADVLARLPDYPANKVPDLLPWNWKANLEHKAAVAA